MSISRDFVGMKIPHYTDEELDEIFNEEMVKDLMNRIYGDYYLPPEPHQYRLWGYDDV